MTGAAAVVAALSLAAAARPDTATSPAFGKVPLVWPEGAPASAVLLLEGDGGWERRMRELAATLASDGALVIGVDTARYVGRPRGRCAYAAGDLEVLSQTLQKSLGLPAYLKPVLVGYSSGATLAYAALAQAPSGTFAGAVSIGFCSDLPTAVPLCAGETLRRERRGAREVLSPAAVRAPWKLYAGTRDRSCGIAAARAFAAGVAGAEVVALDGLGHDYRARGEPWMAQVSADARTMSRSARPAPAPAAENSVVSDLPLVEAPARAPGSALAILVTGDGGWASIDKALAERLTAAGVAVVGLDSLRYFWSRKTPAQLGADLRRIATHYAVEWNRPGLVLLGYSRGADVVPAAIPHLGTDLMARVRLVGLIGPGLDAELELHVADLFSGGRKGAPLLPLASAISAPVLCVYGAEEAGESICPALQDRERTTVVALQGGHHFDGDYDAVARLILAALR